MSTFAGTSSASETKLSSLRLQQLQRQLNTSTTSRAEYNMASEDSKSHNNADLQLSELFNVKDKVRPKRNPRLRHLLIRLSICVGGLSDW